MKILVAGGAGFLGTNLCEQLLKTGHEVLAVDNLITGSKNNIEYLLSFKDFTFMNHDIVEYKDFDVDGIFNLACPASPPLYQKDPVRTVKTNIIGSSNLLDLALKTNSRILQASTSEIYGDPKISPQIETYWGNVNPIGIRSCYDEGKRTAETLFMDFHRQYGTDIRIARIFNTYGPRMSINDGRVVSNFIVQSLTNKDLTIYGKGDQVRSFCYVDDLIEGLIKLFFKDNCHQPINLGNPDPIDMVGLATEVITLTSSNSKISYKPLPSDDPVNRIPDISKAIDEIDWKPTISRSEGLVRTIEYFSKELNISS
jgi:UDP-glucuronate decarboxylase